VVIKRRRMKFIKTKIIAPSNPSTFKMTNDRQSSVLSGSE
jgi:hypothetical protein